ncbi:hypothetical protein [Polaromonas sp.]|uniref:hypothetical protein n=1 Tax=Polaromonas sp. TaxID=1869339 RepID=UPI00248A85F7|nr:hypothetical protein [Polaromonas sp.]MDI1274970.1 hypothetical protein [Polaromonas sp.]
MDLADRRSGMGLVGDRQHKKEAPLIKSCFSSCESGKLFADFSGPAGLLQGAQASRLTTALLKEA